MLRHVWAELLARKSEALAKTGKCQMPARLYVKPLRSPRIFASRNPAISTTLPITWCSPRPCPAKLVARLSRSGPSRPSANYIASGFDNPYKLRTDPRLEPLRKREDFQKLVHELELKVKRTKEP